MLVAEMSQHSSKSSFNYDTLGDIPLFYIPTPPPPVLIVETEPRSRWSVDTEDLEAVRHEASAVMTLAHRFLAVKAELPFLQPRRSAFTPPPVVQHLWRKFWRFMQHLWSERCYGLTNLLTNRVLGLQPKA